MNEQLSLGDLLAQALPYIQQYYNKTVVVKYGGNAMTNEELKQAVMGDIILLNLVGVKVVLVHGGGPEISEQLDKIGKESKFIDGLRYTDEETMDVVQMVLAGKVNKDLVSLIQQQGGKAAGLCGVDGGMLYAKKHEQGDKEYGYVGDIVQVNTDIISTTLDAGMIPVIASIALGEDGNAYNVNADTAAASIAAALGAVKLIVLTDVMGVMKDMKDPSTLITHIPRGDVHKLIEEGIIRGGMIPKVECCMEALEKGVGRTHIIDGRVKHSIIIEMLTNAGNGTMID